MQSRYDAQQIAGTMRDYNVAAHRIVHVDALGLARLPRTRRETVWFARERTHRTQVDHVAGELRGEQLLYVGADLCEEG